METRHHSMRKGLLALVLAILAAPAAWGTTISGNLSDVAGAAVTSTTASAKFTLMNYGSNIPRITGTTTIVRPKATISPDDSGAISGTIVGNDTITPTGTFYRVCVWHDGRQFRCADYEITGASWDLNSATPLTTSPVVSPPTGDSIYLRLDGGNQATGNIVPNSNGTQALGNLLARWDLFGDSVDVNSLSIGGSSALTSSAATGTGDLVRASSPTLVTPDIGAATADSLDVTGAATLNGGGSLNGTFTGNPTFGGAVTLSGSVGGSVLQGTDSKLLTAGTISGTGSTLCVDSFGGASTSGCTSASTVATWEINYPSSLTATATGAETVMPSAQTAVRVTVWLYAAPVGCTTYPRVALYNISTSTQLWASSFISGQQLMDSGTISLSLPAGNTIAFKVTTAASGCSTSPQGPVYTLWYE